jgi:hypothetical protein
MIKILELFAGKNSFSKIARERFFFKTTTTDIKALPGIDVQCDIADFRVTGYYDAIWASPECRCFSIASGGKHFLKIGGTYKSLTEDAEKSRKMVTDMIRVIHEALVINPALLFYNPVGLITKVSDLQVGLFCPFLFREVRIDQCYYGRDCKKPTMIYTNSLSFKGMRCLGATCNHIRRDTEGKHRYHGKYALSLQKGYYAAASLPEKLCTSVMEDILKNTRNKIR